MTNWDIKKLVLTVSAALLLTACQQAKQDEKSKDSAEKGTEQVETLKEEDKIGYAVGAKMAAFIRNDLAKYELSGINKESVIAGFEDSLKDQSKLNPAEMEQEFVKFQEKIRAAQIAVQKEAETKALAEAEVEFKDKIEEGKAFLAENATKEGVKVTETGLQYRVITEGKPDAAKPTSASDRVKVHYHGTFIDGKVFDSSVERGQPASFGLNQVIKGWTEGVQLMSEGSKYHFVIPWELAYGWQGRPGIPKFSVLQFEVELLAVNPDAKKAEENPAK